jgi:hypothetical protein
MSDLMLLGILRMPMPEVPNPDEVVAYTQFVLTARQAAARIEELERELAEAKRDAEPYREFRKVAMKYFTGDAEMKDKKK